MPRVSDLSKSKYLKQDDIDDSPVKVTIAGWEQVELESNGKKESRYIIKFKENIKPLVLNKTNGNRIAKIVGDDNFDSWVGAVVVLYVDPDVEMSGEIVGGVRIRAPKSQQQEEVPF